jgi:single-strand DNA-binding protein
MVLNHIILSGNLTADIELKQTPSGVSVAKFTLAVNRRFAKEGAEKKTDFIRCVAWRHGAEFLANYAGKGTQIVVEGHIEQEEYTDKNGNKRDAITVVAENVQVIASKRTEGAQDTNKGEAEYVPTHYEQNATDGFVAVDSDLGLPF